MSKHRHPARKVSHGQIANEPSRVANTNEPVFVNEPLRTEAQISQTNEATSESNILPFAQNRPSLFEFPLQMMDLMMKPWEQVLRLNPFTQWMLQAMPEGTFLPKSESEETENAYIYRLKMPGLKAAEMALEVANNMLVFSADQSEEGESRSLRRSFSLPNYIDGSRITATLENGTLSVTIPKSDQPVAADSGPVSIQSR